MIAALRYGSVITVDDRGHTKITAPDCRTVHGAPQYNAEQAATARALGYGEDVAAMVADHDPLHALLADWIGLGESAALFGGRPEVEAAEEAAVLAVQKYMRLAGGRMPWPGR
jgi:hypothetical protein